MVDQDRLDAMTKEQERAKDLCLVSYDIKNLELEFSSSYLDITTVLLRSNIPVYRKGLTYIGLEQLKESQKMKSRASAQRSQNKKFSHQLQVAIQPALR